MAFTVARTDKMHGTRDEASLVNVKIFEDLENGCVVKVGPLAEGEREAYEAEQPVSADSISELALLIAPELMYDERKKNLNEYINEKDMNGGIYRAYRFCNGDEFSLTAEGFTGDLAVGNVVEIADAWKMNVVASASGATKVGTIIAQENEYWVVRVQC